MQRLAPTLSKLKSKKEGSLTKTVPDPHLYLGLIKLSADFTTVLNRKILCGLQVACCLGSRAHPGYTGSTVENTM